MRDSHQYLSYEEERGMDRDFEAHQERLAQEQDERKEADAEPELHPTLLRFTHVRCGWVTLDPTTLTVLNDLDVGCPFCASDPFAPGPEAYGTAVWEHRDGTLWETESLPNGEVIRNQPVRTHVQIYKSWVNGPEWWAVPRPNTGDIDGSDNLIVGFDTYQQMLDAIPRMREIFDTCAGPDGIAWRDRNDPIYQTTTPKEGLRF